MKWLVKWDDEYLTHIDIMGCPWWSPRNEAREYSDLEAARAECRTARLAEVALSGEHGRFYVVRVS
jgi:hypothetical protein